MNYTDQLASDMYKVAYGKRPDEYFWEEFWNYDAEGQGQIIRNLQKKIDEVEDAAELMYETQLQQLRREVRETMDTLQCDWKKAIAALAMHRENMRIMYPDELKNETTQAMGLYEVADFLYTTGIGWKNCAKIEGLYYG